MNVEHFLNLAADLEVAGLQWYPEVGDEVADRAEMNMVSILVDPQGMTPSELRTTYIWLPTVEQLLMQFEARQATLFHAGFECTERDYYYKTVIQSNVGHIETKGESMRLSLGIALKELLLSDTVMLIN